MMNYSLTVKELKGHGKPLSFLKDLVHVLEMEGQGAANAGSYRALKATCKIKPPRKSSTGHTESCMLPPEAFQNHWQ